MTVTKRKTGWGVYAQHSGITKALSGPRRKEGQICDYISNWLQKASESSVHHSIQAKGSTMQPPHDPTAALTIQPLLTKAAQFPIWIEDVRAVHIKLAEDKVRRGRSTVAAVNPIDVRWEISSGERERFLVTLPLVMQSASEDLDPHAHQRRKAEFVQGDAEGASDSGASGVEGASDGGAEGEDN